MILISDKLLFYNSGYLQDVLKNRIPYTESNFEQAGFSPLLYSGNTKLHHKFSINHMEYTVVLDHQRQCYFKEVCNQLLEPMKLIEYLIFQYLIGRSFNAIDFKIWASLIKLEHLTKEGHIDSVEYNNYLGKLKTEDSCFIDAYVVYLNIRTLHELIIDELFHSEFRFIDCINSQIENIFIYTTGRKFQNGEESIAYSLKADNAGWCIQDTIKSLSTCLDGLSKLVYYLNDLSKISKRIPAKHFSDIFKLIENDWQTYEGKDSLLNDISQLTLLNRIRDEFTHNNSLSSLRQPVFIGKGTHCVKNLPLLYSELLFWDHDGTIYDRANGKIGFFKHQINALNQTKEFLIQVVKIVTQIEKYIFENIKDELLRKQIKVPIVSKYDEKAKNEVLQAIDLEREEFNIRFT